MIRNNYIVLDVETQILDEAGRISGPGGKANPYGGSSCVIAGFKSKDSTVVNIVPTLGGSEGRDCLLNYLDVLSPTILPVLVGHNVGFDLHHLLHGVDESTIPDFTIWDTQTAEYYIEGQAPEVRWNKLDTLSAKYGAELKDDRISEYFKAGIGADKIPTDEIIPYLANDVLATEIVFLSQFERASEMGMLPLLRQMFDAQCATWLMERNGMSVNSLTVDAIEEEYTEHRQTLDKDLADQWVEYFPLMEEKDRNHNSNQQLLAILSSGSYKYREREKVGVYKNGNDKFKFMDKTARVVGFDFDVTEVGESTLRTLDCQLVRDALKLRKLRKTLDTYVKGYLRKTDSNGILRTNYSQTATPTGRVSSSNPNLQNLPK